MLVKASFHFTPDERRLLLGAVDYGLQEIQAMARASGQILVAIEITLGPEIDN